jgi:exopolysaccharide production protein ExoZ
MSDAAPSTAILVPQSRRSGMIDLWRAIACLAVVLYHGSETPHLPTDSPLVTVMSSLGHHGWLGVPMFFVISGLCLAQAVQIRAAQTCGVIAFWKDRLLRIYPVYWAALLLALLLALIATPFNGLPASSAFPSSTSALLSNLTLVTNWTGHQPQLTVSWSLDYEIGFYVLVGAALFAPLRRTSHRLWLYLAITTLAHMDSPVAWFPLLDSWPAFACGLAVHSALQTKLSSPVRFLALLYPLALAALALLTEVSLSAAFAPAFALCLLASLAWEPRLPPPPRALCAIGLASYSIYLVHIPFMSPMLNLFHRLLAPDSAAYTWVWIGHLIVGVTSGLLFYHLIERRCETLRTRLSSHSRSPYSVATA